MCSAAHRDRDRYAPASSLLLSISHISRTFRYHTLLLNPDGLLRYLGFLLTGFR